MRKFIKMCAMALIPILILLGGIINAKSGPDISKRVELNFWMLGDPPKDLQLINDELNKLTLRDLNCTVKINMTTWTDWAQKYNLLLSSGQPIDLLFTADWVNYNQYAKKGAYTALYTLVPKYAPNLYKFVPKDMWEAVKVDGNIYTMPATWKEYVEEGIMYRNDLRKKYNLPVPDSLENLEKYLDGIKANEPTMDPSTEQVAEFLNGSQFCAISMLQFKPTHKWVTMNGMAYGLVADYASPRKVHSYWGSPEMADDMKLMKRFADKGFWSRNVLSNKTDPLVLFNSGKVAALFATNPVKFSEQLQRIKASHPDWEVAYYPYARTTKLIRPVHPIHNGFAIPRSAKNPERALMFYEKLVLDKTYNRLTEYGIEGKHYTIENGKYYKMLGDSNSNGFQRETMCGWAWRNPNYQLFDKSFDTVLALFKEFDSISKPDIFSSFVEDYTPYQAERAAVFQVTTQYLTPLHAGLVANPEAGLKTFMEKAKEAGLDKIQKEYIKQWLKYCDEKGIK